MHRELVWRWAPRAAAASAVLSVLATAVAIALYLANRDRVEINLLYGDYVAGVLYPCVGAFLLRRRPDNRIGWVFAATSVLGLNALASQYAVSASLVHDGWPLADLAAWLAAWAWVPELFVPALLPLLFPDGSLATRRWRPVALTAVAALTVSLVTFAFSRHPIDSSDEITNPWTVTDRAWLFDLSRIGILGVLACTLLGLVSLVVRTRRARGTQRAQSEWLLLSVVVTVILAVVALLVPDSFGEAIWGLAMAAIPAGVVIAVARHGLLDIEVVLNRTIAYALLTGAVVAGYLAAVSVVGQVAAQRLGIGAAAALALLVAAARDRVQRVVDHALFGARRDPYAVVDRVGRRLDEARGTDEALQQMALELQTALRLPSVAIEPDAPGLGLVAVGSPVAGTTDVPITLHGSRLGVLRIGRRHRGERLRAEEQSVLHDVARRAAALLQAEELVADLRASRERIVAAREEERRRLRHDLHDGVGPQLAGLALQLDSLARRLRDDPESAARVQTLRDQLRETVGEIRRVVDDLRPPALDDVGLVEAVRQQVAAYALVGAGAHPAATPAAPMVEVVSDAAIAELPAAVEVAAYRIVTEAVANAVRHGSAEHCHVSIEVVGGELAVAVTDDGSGIPADAVPGIGLTSMRERAAEVGGRFTVESGPGGTRITAWLPVEQM